MIRRKFPFLWALLVGIAMGGLAPPARADFVLILSDGVAADTKVLKDPGGTGVINYNGAVGNFNIVVTTALSKPAVGDPYNAVLHLNNVSVSTKGGGTLTMTTYDTNYNFAFLPTGTQAVMSTTIGGVISANSGSSGTFAAQAWFDGGNTGNSGTLPAFAAPSGSTAAFQPQFVTVSSSFSGSSDTGVVLNGKFALVEQASFTFGNGGGHGSFDVDTSIAAPAPPGVLLVLSAFPLLGLGYLRRRMTSAVA